MYDKIVLAVAVLGGLSEALSLIPSIEANGVFQLVKNIVMKVKEKMKG
jgi:hypothetical protein